jgi:hypothetical protein
MWGWGMYVPWCWMLSNIHNATDFSLEEYYQLLIIPQPFLHQLLCNHHGEIGGLCEYCHRRGHETIHDSRLTIHEFSLTTHHSPDLLQRPVNLFFRIIRGKTDTHHAAPIVHTECFNESQCIKTAGPYKNAFFS